MKLFDVLSIEIFGASHAEEIGVNIFGVPKGTKIDKAFVQSFVDRRKSVKEAFSTARREDDHVMFESGINGDTSDGGVIRAVIKNTNVRRGDYSNIKHIPRPSHADYPAKVKYGLNYDLSGGGMFSGRMTAPLCIAGAIAKAELERKGIYVHAYVSEIGGVRLGSYREREVGKEDAENAVYNPLFALEKENADKAYSLIEKLKSEGDSVGGAIECLVFGLPVGLGGALFCGMEGKISASVFAVPAVKAVEFGTGVSFSSLRGSEANDEYYFDGDKVKTYTNNCGGIAGGMTTGMPLKLRVSVKPTPSIAKEQRSVDLVKKENVTLKICGRHDSCIVPRAVAPVEAAVALAIYDEALKEINDINEN